MYRTMLDKLRWLCYARVLGFAFNFLLRANVIDCCYIYRCRIRF